MFLKLLEVLESGTVIRHVEFKRGLNLVLGMSTDDEHGSGNNVGKTTLLRAIDFCLGGDGKNLYRDREFPDRRNEEVYQFLHSDGVEFVLVLEAKKTEVTIRRSFTRESRINDEAFGTEEAFRAELGKRLFGARTQKPSFRQLISKFVRLEDYSLEHTLYYLHPSVARSEYEPIYLFLFGFPDHALLQLRREIVQRGNKLQKSLTALRGLTSASLRQALKVIERRIKDAEQQLARFDVKEGFQRDVARLTDLRERIAILGRARGIEGLQLSATEQAIQDLRSTYREIDSGVLLSFYEDAQAALSSIAKSFDELVSFHNKMVDSKIRFLTQSIEAKKTSLQQTDKELSALLINEQALLKDLDSKGAFVDLQRLRTELQDAHEEKGRSEGILRQINDLEAKKLAASSELKEVETSIIEYRSELEKRVIEFNRFFASFSKRIFGQEFVYILDLKESGKSIVEMGISNVGRAEGTGKKRGEVSSFDLAYLRFLQEFKTQAPRFVLHDKIEVIDIHQMDVIFEIANEIDGQFVVAVLHERIESLGEQKIQENTILNLSNRDRFFKLPSAPDHASEGLVGRREPS